MCVPQVTKTSLLRVSFTSVFAPFSSRKPFRLPLPASLTTKTRFVVAA